MGIPSGLFKIVKEILRHLLRRPVAGVCVIARTEDGKILLIRRGDTGDWALPGGTVEWGETYKSTAERELLEEAGVSRLEHGALLGAYSAPERDPRFHAVTLVVGATIEPPTQEPENPVEILEVGLFREEDLPKSLSHGTDDMLHNGLKQGTYWE